ncbi:C1 family peptidase [[Mycoplasma] gypis]|uniref:Aminopeptidase n=1 Tax=[Mycoplasma] gypis TaxID=92404 RepID=A0ABZ2RPY1_9BACT|nr:C1 family peptidase [[Mycoplasma] gypis]MBN0919348.1 C1 family peptidase [[Mycoplasma] gypis]
MTVTNELLKEFKEKFQSNKENLILTNAITKNGIKNSVISNEVLKKHNHVFSNEISSGAITNQKSSGRCWIFASLNMERIEAAKKLNIEDIEFSQSYLLFYDKIEKSNTFLQNMIEYGLELDVYDPLFLKLMDGPADDGGFWEWFLGLITKYGIVPKQIMPDTFEASNTASLMTLLNFKLKQAAAKMRADWKEYKNKDSLLKIKKETMYEVYSLCAKSLGIPPQTFDFKYYDKDKKFQQILDVTPKEFFDLAIGDSLKSKVCLVSDPRPEHPVGKVLTSRYFRSVYEAVGNSQLNVPMDELIKATKDSILDGVAVPFACDVARFHDRKIGIMDSELYDYKNTIYDIEMSKADRLNYQLTLPTHLMNFTGVDIDSNGNILKWKVENSWGSDIANKGFFSISNQWFKDWNFQCVVDRKYIDPKYLKGLEEEPFVLDPSDPLAYLH